MQKPRDETPGNWVEELIFIYFYFYFKEHMQDLISHIFLDFSVKNQLILMEKNQENINGASWVALNV